MWQQNSLDLNCKNKYVKLQKKKKRKFPLIHKKPFLDLFYPRLIVKENPIVDC